MHLKVIVEWQMQSESIQSAIFVTRLSPRAVDCKQSGSVLSVLLYFTLKELLTKYTSLKFNALSANLWNKRMVSFDQNMSTVLPFYNYPSILYLPNYSSVSTYFIHYGSYRTVVSFDLPTHNTINYVTAVQMQIDIVILYKFIYALICHFEFVLLHQTWY